MRSRHTPYDERYARPGWYWGLRPNHLCRKVVRLFRREEARGFRLVDLGAGEGRDLIHFARNGFQVIGVDTSRVGLDKALQRASRLHLPVRVECADIRTWRPSARLDVVFSSGTLGMIPPRERTSRIEEFKSWTVPGGINALNAFVEKPYLRPPPEMDRGESRYRSGELMGYYWDWHILDAFEVEFDCNSSGVPHRHAMDVLIARKPMRESAKR